MELHRQGYSSALCFFYYYIPSISQMYLICFNLLMYFRLSGLSPFMGGTDVETMANVTIAKYDFDDDAFQDISESAKDFIKKLLLKDIR